MALTDEQRQTIRERRARNREMYAPGKLTEDQRQEIVRLYSEGEQIGALARRFGVRRQTVAYHLDKAMI